MLSVLLKVTQQLDKESCSSYWGLLSYTPTSLPHCPSESGTRP